MSKHIIELVQGRYYGQEERHLHVPIEDRTVRVLLDESNCDIEDDAFRFFASLDDPAWPNWTPGYGNDRHEGRPRLRLGRFRSLEEIIAFVTHLYEIAEFKVTPLPPRPTEEDKDDIPF